MRLVVTALAFALLAIVLPACATDGQLSRAAYERELQEAATKIDAASDAVESDLRGLGAGSASLVSVAETIEDARERLALEADGLGEIDPPDDAEAAHAKLVEGLRQLVRDLPEFQEAVDEGDVARIQEFISGFETLASVETIREARRELEVAGYSAGG